MADPCNDPATYAPVLQRMIEILGANDTGVTFGEAMDRASKEKNISVPDHMIEPIMVAAFSVIASGRIPGAPDA